MSLCCLLGMWSPLCLVCMKVLKTSVIKLTWIRCRCSMNENILAFGLSPFCLVYMKVLLLSVIKLDCIWCCYWEYSHFALMFVATYAWNMANRSAFWKYKNVCWTHVSVSVSVSSFRVRILNYAHKKYQLLSHLVHDHYKLN